VTGRRVQAPEPPRWCRRSRARWRQTARRPPQPGGRRFQRGDDRADVLGGRVGEAAPDQDARHGLRHVQPGAAERGVQRHDPVVHQPAHERRCCVSGDVVEHQQHAERRQFRAQGERPGEPLLPTPPARPVLLGREDRGRRQRGQDRLERRFEPAVQDDIGARGNAADANLAGARMDERQQLRCTVADVLVRVAGRLLCGAPLLAGQRDGLERACLVLGPDGESQLLLGGPVRRRDQFLLRAASTSSIATTPALRLRRTRPGVHELRSCCHESPAACSACQLV